MRLALLVTMWVSASAAASPGHDFTKLADGLERRRPRWQVPDMAAGVARDGRVVWERGFGFADLAARRPATPDTVFHLASLTKPFAAVVLLGNSAAQSRKFDLGRDNDVTRSPLGREFLKTLGL